MQVPSLVEILLAKFNGQLLIPLADACVVIGYRHKTALNEIYKEKFPIRVVVQGGRKYICITDLAKYLLRFEGQIDVKAKVGRPTKASKMHALGARGATGGAR